MSNIYNDLNKGLTQSIDLERQISELEDVAASLNAQFDSFVDELCQIIFEGEDTEIGRKATIDRIKEKINYKDWLERE